MSGTLNKAMLIGHLGDNVKVTYFEGGNCIGRFPIATNETYTSKQTGKKVTNTEWHNAVVRNKAAEICEKYLKDWDWPDPTLKKLGIGSDQNIQIRVQDQNFVHSFFPPPT